MHSTEVASDLYQDILAKQKRTIDLFFSHLQLEGISALVERILNLSGNIFFMGVGKSGCIARKIVATLQSIGEKAFLLSPGDLLHGDLGCISSGDLVCLLSKSGETKELLVSLPYIREHGAYLVGVTSASYSSLAASSDLTIALPALEELDPFNLIPTTSTTCQLLFGDLLAMALLRKRKISLSTYGKNHPSGQIGLKANGKVRDYLIPKTEVPFCSGEHTIAQVLKILSTYGCGCVCVVDDAFTLEGIFTDGDLRRALMQFGGDVLNQKIKYIMTSDPKVICLDADIILGLQIMEAGRPVTMLPVVDSLEERHVVGLLHMHVLARAGCV